MANKNYRFLNRSVLNNSSINYKEVLRRKNKGFIKQYSSPALPRIRNISSLEISEIRHIWKTGDRYYKLASRYYGDPTFWWVIAMFNNAPTEGHLRHGDVILVPTPLETVLSFI